MPPLSTSMMFVGPLVAAGMGLACVQSGLSAAAGWTAGLTVLTAMWWVTEPIPIPVTSLIPLAMLPLLGILEPEQVGAAYGDPMILLLLGGSMLSTAMEKSGAHRRLALGLLRIIGGGRSRYRLTLGVMLATAALSMWISNSATTLMMLPIALAMVEGQADRRIAVTLLLAVAYAASIGGIGTPVGTPPNLIFMEGYRKATGSEVSFVQWMLYALPITLAMIPLAAWWLARMLPRKLAIEFPSPGPWRAAEFRTLAIFGFTALLWITRSEPFGGWKTLLHLPAASDASVALLAVVAMFLIPNGEDTGGKLLDWKSAERIPWGVLLLFSSGMVLAQAFQESGLSQKIGAAMAGWVNLPYPLLIGLVGLTVVFLTEVTSNTALASLLMPILAAAAQGAGLPPEQLMAPAAIVSSLGFMLPAGTAPNAIVFSTGRVTVAEMAKTGVVLNLLGVVLVTLWFSLLAWR